LHSIHARITRLPAAAGLREASPARAGRAGINGALDRTPSKSGAAIATAGAKTNRRRMNVSTPVAGHLPMQKWRFRRMLLICNGVFEPHRRAWIYSWIKNQVCLLVAADGPPWTLPALPLPMRCVSRRPDQWQRNRPSTFANVQCAATDSFSHLLIRSTKDVAPCFSPKKREARSSD